MLRGLLIALVLLNALLLAALLGLFGDVASEPREPARLERQVQPERMQLQRAPPVAGNPSDALAPAAAAPDPEASAPLARQAVSALPEAPSSTSQDAPPGAGNPAALASTAASAAAGDGPSAAGPSTVCVELSPLHPSQLAAVQAAMLRQGVPGEAWQPQPLPARAWHWVRMGPYPNRAQVIRKSRELQRRDVAWAELVAAPNLPAGLAPGLSLGRYPSAAAAEQALAALRGRGVRSAEVFSPPALDGLVQLRLPTLEARLWAELQPLTLAPNARWQPCPGSTLPGRAERTR